MISFLLSKTGIVSVIGLGLAIMIGVQTLRLDHAKHDLGEARAALVNPATGHRWEADYAADHRDLTNCRTNLEKLGGAIDIQNNAVTALKAEGDRRRRESAAALSSARRDAGRARSDATAILNRQPPADRCQGALDLIREP